MKRLFGMVLGGLVLALVWALTGTAFAGGSCNVEPARGPYYHLELTIPAAFCQMKPSDASCKTFPKASAIQLHGLWVDYATGPKPKYPAGSCTEKGCEYLDAPPSGEYCTLLPDLSALYQSQAWKTESGYFAGTEKCLERHEWVKHGLCSPMDAARWGTWSLNKTKEIGEKLALPTDRELSRVEIDAAVRTRLPELDGAIHWTCNKANLVSFSVDYAWGPTPGAVQKNVDGQNTYNGCRKTIVILSHP